MIAYLNRDGKSLYAVLCSATSPRAPKVFNLFPAQTYIFSLLWSNLTTYKFGNLNQYGQLVSILGRLFKAFLDRALLNN